MPSEDIAGRLAKLVEIAGSQAKFAAIVGKTGPAVHGWLHGSVPYDSTMATIARKCDVSLEWLRDGAGDEETELGNFRRLLQRGGPPRRQIGRLAEDPAGYGTVPTGGLILKRLPIISMAQAGAGVSWEDVDDYDGVETFAVKDSRAIAVRIRGDSMAPDYKEGTVAIIYPSVEPRSENLVIVRFTNGDVAFKRLHVTGETLNFLSINPKYETISVTRDKIERMLTVGKTMRDEL